jgi:hypothetical protein
MSGVMDRYTYRLGRKLFESTARDMREKFKQQGSVS